MELKEEMAEAATDRKQGETYNVIITLRVNKPGQVFINYIILNKTK